MKHEMKDESPKCRPLLIYLPRDSIHKGFTVSSHLLAFLTTSEYHESNYRDQSVVSGSR